MKTDVEVVRGTTNTFAITLTDAKGDPYTLGEEEKMLFGVKRSYTDSEYVFVKTITAAENGVYSVTINPEDTSQCECCKHYYDVSVQSGDAFFNVVETSAFFIKRNITCRGCG